ncbi:glutaminase [Corynebacterium caspium]|uniref:glutaminase n=1 Tax=Corynebacterium caspium TaxID=234828 RepID=UPI000477AFBC|nr:glutaminase [Corynebacterium caspium]
MNSSPVTKYLNQILDTVRDDDSGEVADYIEELAQADPDKLGIALTTVSGHTYTAGDCTTEFSIQSIAKPFVYALALRERGWDVVHRAVSIEPSGERYNSLSLDSENRPMNPMINAGAITVNQLINGDDSSVPERAEAIRQMLSDLAGRELRLNTELAYSELAGADRNLSLAYMLRSYGIIQDEARAAVLSYIMQCSVMVTTRDLALMASTLANGGIQPETGKRILDPEVCRLTMAVMSSCGMYDGAGHWIATVGIPAKSGVAGGLIGTLPGQLGIATFSPRLDRSGNSVRGIRAFQELSRQMGLHLMAPHRVGANAVRAIETVDDTTILSLQDHINFSATEQILYQISQHDFSASSLMLDVTMVMSIDKISRGLLQNTLLRMQNAGLAVSLYDPDNRLRGMMLDDQPIRQVDTEEHAEILKDFGSQ